MQLLVEEAPGEFVAADEVVELSQDEAGLACVVAPAKVEFTQRQDRANNPHSEHAHDVVIVHDICQLLLD